MVLVVHTKRDGMQIHSAREAEHGCVTPIMRDYCKEWAIACIVLLAIRNVAIIFRY